MHISHNTTFQTFIAELTETVLAKTFLQLTLGNKRPHNNEWKNLLVKPVVIKQQWKLQLVYRYPTNDVTKNETPEKGIEIIQQALQSRFYNADLFTSLGDIHFFSTPEGKAKIVRKAATKAAESVVLEHDRPKQRWVSAEGNRYLQALGVSSADGKVKKEMQDKYRQINHYIGIIDGIVKDMGFGNGLTVTDMGSGKGYLTFALYDYLTTHLNITATVTGIELRPALVEQCNQLAKDCGFAGLEFKEGAIDQFPSEHTDLLIALHACDTATDDAIFSGIQSGAKVIVVAPCCHKEIRKQLAPDNILQQITKHGILAERQAEMLTDSLRALYMESAGYKTKVFEFIATEHTPKNVLIVGVKSDASLSKEQQAVYLQQAKDLQQQFGIRQQHLQALLSK